MPASERSRLGLVIVKSGCWASFSTWSTVSAALRRGLEREPFVEHQRVVVEALVEGVQRGLPLRHLESTRGRRARPAGRSCCRRGRTAPWRAPPPARWSAAAIRPSATVRSRRTPLAAGDRSSPAAPSLRCAASSSCASAEPIAAQRFARVVDGVGVDDVHAVGDQAFARQQDRLGLERRVERVGRSVAPIGADDRLGIDCFAASARGQRAHHHLLHRLVAGERIGIGLREPFELVRSRRSASTMIGAEKSRLIDSNGFSPTLSKRDALLGLVEDDQPLRGDFLRRCRRRSARS